MSEGIVKDTAIDCAGEGDIAIIGMAAQLPGARDVAEFWDNLVNGIESIRRLSEDELIAAGESRARMRHRNYVPAAAPLDGFDMFDAEFFGFSPREAAILDPQHRKFLEVAWHALENAGHMPEHFGGPIGVWGGCGMSSYFQFNLCSNPDLVDDVGLFLLRHTGNDKDFLTTRLSHILDLKGPSVAVQTACSTSLVATHYACQALQGLECDMALAGGATIELPQMRGYMAREGEILSPDGHCHAFDHRARGTVFGSGAGVVVLRRLKDALADGDHIWAVIRGSAINNDGAAKAGYLAPSVDGQAEAVAEAHAMAGTDPRSIGYVECHGTGTKLGDPIEVAALSSAFRQGTAENGFCRIGSVKTNIGHLDTAAGVAGLIKTAMAVHEGRIPASLGFEKPNPDIDFNATPFRVNDRLCDWPEGATPRRAGVNSLGVGGTNAHLVLEQPPRRPASEPSDWPFHILTVSGRSKVALAENAAALAAHLRAHPEENLADIAFTLKQGRRAFEHRRVVVAGSHGQAADYLEGRDTRRVFDHNPVGDAPGVAFLLPGGGAQYAGMARDLYETEPEFRDWMDRGLAVLEPLLDYDIRALWLPEKGQEAAAEERLRRPSVQLPLVMIVEYALARLWMSWGVTPSVLVGHSMGENTAAALAGVMAFEDCIRLVHLRGSLFDRVEPGGMLSVMAAPGALAPLLGHELDIAALNGPELTVVSGPQAALEGLAEKLAKAEIESRRIKIDIAAHSRMLEPILGEFRAFLKTIALSPPQIPILSNRSGDILSDAEATDPAYWVAHLRGTVRFADCMARLAEGGAPVCLEVGPGKALSSLAAMQKGIAAQQVLSSLRHPEDDVADDIHFLETLGRLDALGVAVDWAQIWGEARRNRVVLPAYAFQRARYFIAPGKSSEAEELPERIEALEDWGSIPDWRPQLAACHLPELEALSGCPSQNWLIFLDETGLGARLAGALRDAGHRVTTVRPGDGFARLGDDDYLLAPEQGRAGYDALIRDLMAQGNTPGRIVHLWLLTGDESHRPGSSFFHRNLEMGFYSLTFLAQAIADENLPRPIHLSAITNGALAPDGKRLSHPEKATVAGPLGVIPRELPGLTCAHLDIELPARRRGWLGRQGEADIAALTLRLLEDLLAEPESLTAAYRGDRRLVRTHRRHPLPDGVIPDLPEGGTWLITGGLGGIGLALAERLVRESGAKIALISRGDFPQPADWPRLLRALPPSDHTARRIRALKALQEAGGQVMTLTADVTNIDEMRAAIAATTARFGPIDGVIHAAGVIDDAPLQAKGPAAIEAVFAPKIHGTRVLDALFRDGDLKWLVLFSSTSTVTTPAGQLDYVAANAYLNAYAASRRGDRTQVIALNWGIWNRVGMAAEALAPATDTPPAPEPVQAPLLQRAGFDGAGNRVYSGDVSAGSHWVFDQHRTRAGQAVLPGTAVLELAAEALEDLGEDPAFELRDLLFLRPMALAEGESREFRLTLARSDEGFDLELRSACMLDGRKGFQLHATARILLGDAAETTGIDIDSLRARFGKEAERTEAGGLRVAQEAHLRFGPRWRVLRERALGDGEGFARLELPPAFHGDLDAGFRLHPALLDIATGWAMELIPGYDDSRLWVPLSYGRARLFGALPAALVSHVRLSPTAQGDGVAAFDVTLADTGGRVLAKIKGFAMKRLDGDAALDLAPPPRPGEVVFDDETRTGALPVNERLLHNLGQGILPEEGATLFLRALAAGLPQITVSSLDLEALDRQAAAEAAARSDAGNGQSFERPALDTEFRAPRNDIERTLAGFWQDLLGLESVGIDDDFFDLGGHSLIAVRLFAMIRKAWGADFPISVLFQAPTIAANAELIADRTGATDAGTGGDTPPSRAKDSTRRFRHLVPMHEGEGGERSPFFLVAGMFGNVLNLRHLAQLLGRERPFWGLQARGLLGGEEPHRSIPEAARAYIEEMRVIQPHGPYLLGGFSGGGITAFEIARQLEEAGETVSLVALLDTPLPQRRPLSARDRLLIQLEELKANGPAYPLRWLARRLYWEIARRRKRSETGARNGPVFHNAEIEAAFLEAVAAYHPQIWSGNLQLFRPPLRGKWTLGDGQLVNSERAYLFHDNDWSQFAPNIGVTEVPGDHDSMVLEPNVRVLAARLREAIENAEAACAPSQDLQAAE